MRIKVANPDDRYIWIDLETTGLNPELDCIIQVAAIATDGNLQELGTFETLVAPHPGSLGQMSDFVRNMHTKNGLLEALRTTDPPTVGSVGNAFCAWLRSFQIDNENLYIAGNSVHSVDLPFSKTYMPQIYMDYKELVDGEILGGPLHYRVLDVTSIRLALRLWTGYDFHFRKDGSHLAMNDVRQCISEFKFFRKCAQRYFTGNLKPPNV